MMIWMLTMFVSGFGVAINLNRLMHSTSDYKMASVSIGVFVLLALYCGYAIYHNRTAGTNQSNVDKLVDQFIRSWDRVSIKMSSGRWLFTVVAAAAFFMFCNVVCRILIKSAEKLPDTTIVALFMFLAGIVQNIVKDYFNMDRSDPENSNDYKPVPYSGTQGVPYSGYQGVQ